MGRDGNVFPDGEAMPMGRDVLLVRWVSTLFLRLVGSEIASLS